ncbi:MAG TPA: hypothetical protein VEQ59_13905, partial [Polyangiaceae bacterium]|nr:hypothetical protein [Polyangiaceae bacterium]
MKATVQPKKSRAAAARPALFDSVPPPPVVSDPERGAPAAARSAALLGWAFAPSRHGRFFRARVSVLLTILA